MSRSQSTVEIVTVTVNLLGTAIVMTGAAMAVVVVGAMGAGGFSSLEFRSPSPQSSFSVLSASGRLRQCVCDKL